MMVRAFNFQPCSQQQPFEAPDHPRSAPAQFCLDISRSEIRFVVRHLATMSVFQVPQVVDNSDGWGPSAIPKHLQGVPYAPFGKGDKLGKAADWTAQGYQRYRDRYAQQGGSNAVFSFFHAVRLATQQHSLWLRGKTPSAPSSCSSGICCARSPLPPTPRHAENPGELMRWKLSPTLVLQSLLHSLCLSSAAEGAVPSPILTPSLRLLQKT